MNRKLTRRSVTAGLALARSRPALWLCRRSARAQAQIGQDRDDRAAVGTLGAAGPAAAAWAPIMAIDDINPRGGIKALGGAKLELIYADAGDSTEKAKNAAQRLLARPPRPGRRHRLLAQLVHAGGDRGDRAGAAALADLCPIPTRSPIAASNSSSRPRRPPNGRPPRPCRPLSSWREAATGKRPKTIGIIMDNTASPVSFGKQLREGGGLEKVGLKLVVDQIFTPPLSDATPLIEKVRSAKPDFLLLLTSAMPDCKLVLEKLDEFKLSQGQAAAGRQRRAVRLARIAEDDRPRAARRPAVQRRQLADEGPGGIHRTLQEAHRRAVR